MCHAGRETLHAPCANIAGASHQVAAPLCPCLSISIALPAISPTQQLPPTRLHCSHLPPPRPPPPLPNAHAQTTNRAHAHNRHRLPSVAHQMSGLLTTMITNQAALMTVCLRRHSSVRASNRCGLGPQAPVPPAASGCAPWCRPSSMVRRGEEGEGGRREAGRGRRAAERRTASWVRGRKARSIEALCLSFLPVLAWS